MNSMSIIRIAQATLLALIMGLVASVSYAQTIDFETYPLGGVQTVEDDVITNQYQNTDNVIFSIRPVNTSPQNTAPRFLSALPGQPIIAQVGDPLRAFSRQAATDVTLYENVFPGCFTGIAGSESLDMPDVAEAGTVRCRFLTDDGTVTTDPDALFIEYTGSTQKASGQILDTDGAEAWLIEAFDTANPSNADMPISSYTICGPDAVANVTSLAGQCDETASAAMDGHRNDWTVTAPCGEEIKSIAITYVGSSTVNVGLAFDNFVADAGDCAGCSDCEICCPPWTKSLLDGHVEHDLPGNDYTFQIDVALISNLLQSFADYTGQLNTNIASVGIMFFYTDCMVNNSTSLPCGSSWSSMGGKAVVWDVGASNPPSPSLGTFTIGSGWTWNLPYAPLDEQFQDNRLYRVTSIPFVWYADGTMGHPWSENSIFEDCPLPTYQVNHMFTKKSQKRAGKASSIRPSQLRKTPQGRRLIQQLLNMQKAAKKSTSLPLRELQRGKTRRALTK